MTVQHQGIPLGAHHISQSAFVGAPQVVIRVRPPLPREVDGERMFQNIVSVDKEEHVITISENLNAVLDEVGSLSVLVEPPSMQH